MSGKYGTSNAGAESVGVSDCNKVYMKQGIVAVMSIRLLKHMSSRDSMMLVLDMLGDVGFGLDFGLYGSREKSQTSKALKEIFLEFSVLVSKRCWKLVGGEQRVSDMYVDGPMSHGKGRPIFASDGRSIHECNPLEKQDAEGPSLDEVWKMRSIWMS
ncbi:hypothetical protein Tco_0543803 [Tanacetum coccineum]